MLKATFVRAAGERDRIYVTRSDGSEVSWSFPSYGDGLPHDLVHWVVESCCGLRNAFWGRVDAGADPAVVNAEANRAGGSDKYAGYGPDRQELDVAEALANAGWTRDGATEAEIRESLVTQCRSLGAPAPDLSPTQAERIRSTLRELSSRWRSLLPKGSLTVTFPDSEGRP
jgi:hypothetical protein